MKNSVKKKIEEIKQLIETTVKTWKPCPWHNPESKCAGCEEVKTVGHTPGRWTSHPLIGGINNRQVIDDENTNEHIALVYGEEHDAKSNANLISAAPDLLEMAKSVLRLWDNNGNPAGAFDGLRKAIAKAEGR